MNLADYFDKVKGIGVLGTADSEGKVNLAIYARPHVMDDQTVAFIMQDRRSHAHVAATPHAAYLFIEHGEGYKGLRLHLTRTAEEDDPQKIEAIRRRSRKDEDTPQTKAFLVYFTVAEVRSLVGSSAVSSPQSPSSAVD